MQWVHSIVSFKRTRAWANATLALFVATMAVGCQGNVKAPADPRSSGPAAHVPASLYEAETHAVVLVALDGVRWQEIFEGVDRDLGLSHGLSEDEIVGAEELMPNLHALASRRGVLIGGPGSAPITATGPNFTSLPGYTEMLSGRSPLNCRDNDCPTTVDRTLPDEVRSRTATEDEVAVISSWEDIERAASVQPGKIVISDRPHLGGQPGQASLRHGVDHLARRRGGRGSHGRAWRIFGPIGSPPPSGSGT